MVQVLLNPQQVEITIIIIIYIAIIIVIVIAIINAIIFKFNAPHIMQALYLDCHCLHHYSHHHLSHHLHQRDHIHQLRLTNARSNMPASLSSSSTTILYNVVTVNLASGEMITIMIMIMMIFPPPLPRSSLSTLPLVR